MRKIYVTGDTHGSNDISKLYANNFTEQDNMTKNDFVIITGDFGLIWSNSLLEKTLLNRLNNKPFTTLFVDGNHENFNLLKKYPIKEWNGGKVRVIRDSIYQLLRGQVYVIDGIKIFTMGGATSTDKDWRIEGVSWWPEEVPCKEEYDEAIKNLDMHNWKVDYVITHTTSLDIMNKLGYIKEDEEINEFMGMVQNKLEYKKWYFGHFHDDLDFGKHIMLYDKIIKLGEGTGL